jgi:antitoxin ParD1/3/4
MTTLNISLPENLKAFVEDQVSSGGFSTVSEYIRSLIRDAQERRARGVLEAKLLAALEKEPEEMLHDDWEQLRDRVRQLSGKTSRP